MLDSYTMLYAYAMLYNLIESFTILIIESYTVITLTLKQ